MKSAGICIGASTISFVLTEKIGENISVVKNFSERHEGNPRKRFLEIVEKEKLEKIDKIAVTGRKIKNNINLSIISEPETVEYAFKFNKKKYSDVNIIVSAGGETFLVYEIDNNGKIIDVFTGNKCASGTGEFFLQQINRMNMTIEEALEDLKGENSYKLAGRCSVFCKSDCTHALNKGTSKESVVSGLSEMMAGKILELLNNKEFKSALVIGGTSKNKVMIDFLSQKLGDIKVPEYADVFEALGASLWAMENKTLKLDRENVFKDNISSFSFLEPLLKFKGKVKFETADREKFDKANVYILGLDVGSTTTKSVLLNSRTNRITASCYLRTNGDPIGAARECYREILSQCGDEIKVVGIGVTGSGRQIAGLHASTKGVINEIITHAVAAVFFDKDVDTIYEIGGQDAKYTFITNGVPSDYAMNEACSAGTGSFLEESAKESLGIGTLEIEEIALKSKRPPNFSDQCSAFISSDIKSAIQEGISKEDITAGLVYSVCLNYINRVRGSRPSGRKIFMQGGVCYNKAVPIAMAALTGNDIIVPPDPGLMGAFGAALEIKNRIESGLLENGNFDLKELAERNLTYKDSFICAGGKEKCDRKCVIKRVDINNKTYPFGGACNKYYNIIQDKKEVDTDNLNLAVLREELVFKTYSIERGRRIREDGRKIGINNALLTNTLFPLYYNFFYSLGFDIVLSEKTEQEGIDRKSSNFCYPVEIAHGQYYNLINKKPDYVFLPHLKYLHVENGNKVKTVCPLVQGEPYYLTSSFNEYPKDRVISPVLDFSEGYETAKNDFINIAQNLGIGNIEAEKSFEIAVNAQNDFHSECQRIGKQAIHEAEKNNETMIVLFGRPYNAFTKIANMGIPHKFASRGYRIMPSDFLPFKDEENHDNMYWASGQIIMKGSKYIEKRPSIFGIYISNFSCGPDSFIISYFRKVMGKKPSLILELDSHTADAGVDTRIEAFLDIVKSYTRIAKDKVKVSESKFIPAEIFLRDKQNFVKDSDGNELSLKDPKVHIFIPTIGTFAGKLMSACFRYSGYNATSAKPPGEEEVKTGRAYSFCKECLPLTLTIGTLMNYLKTRENEDEIVVYFMPETSGPCRFGQYNILMKSIIEKHKIRNVALLSLTSENSYSGMGTPFTLRTWQSIIINDIFDEIRSAVTVLAKDKVKALETLDKLSERVVRSVHHDHYKILKKVLKSAAAEISKIERIGDIHHTPKIALIGEIYVRRDDFSKQDLIEKLAEKGIITKVAPLSEWFYYTDYLISKGLTEHSDFKDRMKAAIKGFFKNRFEKDIKKIFADCGFYEYKMADVSKLVENVEHLISPELTGEAILTVGAAITEVVDEVDGVISVSPFGCMPARIAESIVNSKLSDTKRNASVNKELVNKVMEQYPALPFMSIEVDGNPFPQITDARIETFALQVGRIHKCIQEVKRGNK